ncbi:MAG: histidine--tRNA ligase [Coprobacillus sp.]|nr:histidine--tRNA ligase [Coprobacillus sp.]
MNYQKVKGTHDFTLDKAEELKALESIFLESSYRYNYHYHDVPVMEYSELYLRSVGEGSDIVRKEMYTFLDKGNRSITLRPEFTAGIVRSIVENKMQVTSVLPIKSCYFGRCYRYERPQAGRYREFYQGGVECVGTKGVNSDIEVISLLLSFFNAIGIKESVLVKLNYLGSEETRKTYSASLKEYFLSHIEDMCEDCKERVNLNPLRILDCKAKEDQKIIEGAPKISEFLSDSDKENLNMIISYLKDKGITYEYDRGLVRGLDYYSGLVFEIYPKDNPTSEGALAGGGHYYGLVKELGGGDLEGVGFSFGAERLLSYLEERGISLAKRKSKKIYVMPLSPECLPYSEDIASSLREAGYLVEVDYSLSKITSMFKKAERLDMDLGVIIGEDEVSSSSVHLKDLRKKEEKTVSKEGLLGEIEK